jgi:hypothetical protein
MIAIRYAPVTTGSGWEILWIDGEEKRIRCAYRICRQSTRNYMVGVLDPILVALTLAMR